MNPGDNQILIQLVIGVTSVVGTYLTVKYKPQIFKQRSDPQVVRSSFLFDGYEKLITELQDDLVKMREINETQHEKLMVMEDKARDLEDNLLAAREENKRLVQRLRAYETVN